MSTIHAWFSQAAALIHGSEVYRKESGSTVNVTRMSDENEAAGFFRHTEKYVGRVIRAEDGGCVGAMTMVDGITSQIMRASDVMRAKDEAAAVKGIDGWENDGGHTKPER
ncbi:MAG TPA: hypothetical protein VGQ99_13920 [Tepidisphaeraceae bacterium]|jgi:hypothetical protein|nr:hypothetical protein [Tepidisphaeraceae bacterium]